MRQQGRNFYQYRYLTKPNQGESIDTFQLNEYRYMLNRLNRENQCLSLNVQELMQQNERLKTEISQKRKYQYQEQNRKQQSSLAFKNRRYELPKRQTEMKKLDFPFSEQLSTQQRTEVPKSELQQRSQESNTLLSIHTQSPTIIDELKQECFENTDNKTEQAHKFRKGLQLSKKIINSPEKDLSTSKIQLQAVASPQHRKEIIAKLAQYHSDNSADAEKVLGQIKKGIQEVKIYSTHQNKKRGSSFYFQRQKQGETTKQKTPVVKAKKDNAPYRIDFQKKQYNSIEGQSNPISSPSRNNQSYIQSSPRFAYGVPTVRPFSYNYS